MRRAAVLSGGTYICQQALLAGRIDTYVEYTGTALTAILHDPPSSVQAGVINRVQTEYQQRFGLEVLPSLGFNNTFAIVVRGEDARRLHLKTISAASPYAHPPARRIWLRIHGTAGRLPGTVRDVRITFAAAPGIWIWGCCTARCWQKAGDIVAGNSTDGLLAARDLIDARGRQTLLSRPTRPCRWCGRTRCSGFPKCARRWP